MALESAPAFGAHSLEAPEALDNPGEHRFGTGAAHAAQALVFGGPGPEGAGVSGAEPPIMTAGVSGAEPPIMTAGVSGAEPPIVRAGISGADFAAENAAESSLALDAPGAALGDMKPPRPDR